MAVTAGSVTVTGKVMGGIEGVDDAAVERLVGQPLKGTKGKITKAWIEDGCLMVEVEVSVEVIGSWAPASVGDVSLGER